MASWKRIAKCWKWWSSFLWLHFTACNFAESRLSRYTETSFVIQKGINV